MSKQFLFISMLPFDCLPFANLPFRKHQTCLLTLICKKKTNNTQLRSLSFLDFMSDKLHSALYTNEPL